MVVTVLSSLKKENLKCFITDMIRIILNMNTDSNS